MLGLNRSNTNGGIRVLDFGADRIMRSTASASVTGYIQPLASAQTEKVTADPSVPTLRNNAVYAVTSVVLDDAPIDTASGMRVPTYILGSTGIEVLRHDGTRINSANAANPSDGIIVLDNKAIHHRYGASLSSFIPFPEWLEDQFSYTLKVDNVGHSSTNIPVLSSPQPNMCADGSDVLSQIASLGMARIRPNYHDYAQSKIAFSAADYATGWMYSGTTGCWLSSVDTSTLAQVDYAHNTNAQLLGEGGLTGYDAPTETYFIERTVGSGTGTISFPVPAGTRVRVSYEKVSGSSVLVRDGNTVIGTTSDLGVFEFTCQEGSVRFNNGAGGQSSEFKVHGIDVMDFDRSVKETGLVVPISPLARTPVATGAELVGYGPFDRYNTLTLPSDGNLPRNVFTNMFIEGWMYQDVQSSGGIMEFGENTSGKRRLLYKNGSGDLMWNIGSGQVEAVASLKTGVWQKFSVLHDQNEDVFIWVDGVLRVKKNLVRSNPSSAMPLMLGGFQSGATVSALSGKLALIRGSQARPSNEEVYKAYLEELPMFRPNSKVTLHGPSNLISALAHDETTGLVHAGTSAGRSDFSGLVRVGQTDTPITTKIVAHDGMILEQ